MPLQSHYHTTMLPLNLFQPPLLMKVMDFSFKEVQVIYFSYVLIYFHGLTFPLLKIHICLRFIKKEEKKVQYRCLLYFHVYTVGG